MHNIQNSFSCAKAHFFAFGYLNKLRFVGDAFDPFLKERVEPQRTS